MADKVTLSLLQLIPLPVLKDSVSWFDGAATSNHPFMWMTNGMPVNQSSNVNRPREGTNEIVGGDGNARGDVHKGSQGTMMSSKK